MQVEHQVIPQNQDPTFFYMPPPPATVQPQMKNTITVTQAKQVPTSLVDHAYTSQTPAQPNEAPIVPDHALYSQVTYQIVKCQQVKVSTWY